MTTLNALPQSITDRLADLRRRVRTWIVIDGVSRLLAAAVGWVFVSLLVDYLFHMDLPQRVIMLLILLAALGYIAYRRLLRPLGQRLSADDLAMQVERRYPQLGDGLISALQLSRMNPEATGASPELVNAAIDRGASLAEPLDFSAVLNRKLRTRNVNIAASAVLAFVLAWVGLGGTMPLWAQRNLLLSAAAEWPQNTHLKIVHDKFADGVLTLARGDDLNLRVEAEGETPKVVYLDHKPTKGRRRTDQMIKVGDSLFRYELTNVLEPFRFRVRGGDAVTPWHQVKLIDRPTVETLKLYVTPPDYTGRPRRLLPPGEGAYRALEGSTLEVTGVATKDLDRAVLMLGNDRVGDFAIAPDNPRAFRYTLAPAALASGSYGVNLLDSDDYWTRRPIRFNVKVAPDEAPSVRAKLVGIGDLITANAVAPITVRVTDDFSIEAVRLTYTVAQLEAGESTEPKTIAIAQVADQLGSSEIDEFTYRLEIGELGVPVDAHVSFKIEAVDNDAVDGPNTGASAVFSAKVVTEQELRNELLRREQEQRVEFERLLKDQQTLEVDARAMLAEVGAAEKLTPDQFARLGAIEKRQRLVAGRCEGIARQFEQILMEIVNNRLEDAGGPTQRRLQQRIIGPLLDIANVDVRAASDAFDAARKASLEAERRPQLMGEAVEHQQAILAQMRLILRNMVKLEGYQEAVNLLREIIKSQKDVNQQTIKELEKQIENIFDD